MSRRFFRSFVLPFALVAAAGATVAKDPVAAAKPTIVLVHGAFADSSSWNGVAGELRGKGYPVVAVANPLRSLSGDSRYTASVLDQITGPIVLVGHSYGGSIISNAAVGKAQVRALVFVSAFAPEAGESVADLAGKFPGSSLGDALAKPVPLPDGGVDLYIDQARFRGQFAADVNPGAARLMAIGQRPVAEAALKEGSPGSAWKGIPSYFIYGSGDKNIPSAAMAWMAERAHARQAVVIQHASHVPQVSHPHAVASLIEAAARSAD
ncbi:alpha/beta fold hydrolase [Piscinibacter gummiphilus]|uniref:Alpha/beta hydrolase n=1 Tax=Piscinibacter gummiphilus TaxID=946333 RepID=A0A1W6L342_9BURK|nr:alpha/beta hydrolase [Piscinibacter gummiphilus]ARN18701.1 alpha/beta hydrolase [Piscinibacter gummiphilus]ATU63338.1 alpha/beta hydrolase [Piscinibacter gummiphilus]GLS95848.1 alpha/beta hydrolase [Piscinibacter gummiphilus]